MNSLLSLFLKPELPPKVELAEILRPYGFRNPAKAWKSLSPFLKNEFDRSSFAALLPALLDEFSRSPDPDQAALHFASFAEASFNRSQLFQFLARVQTSRKVLSQVLGLSPALASTLCQEPGLLYWLFEEEGLYKAFAPKELREELRREAESVEDVEGKLNALRRVKRREMLRLGARDLLGLCDVKELTFEMAGFADALLEGTLAVGRLAVKGPEPKGRFTVIGMGKLGGQELNYSSDIDLLFVYEAAEDEEELSNRYFNELAEWVIHAMTDSSAMGNLFRVDMRLRPEGMGDMARSLDSYLEHYETRSQPWELQALSKARPCAGDPGLGKRFLEETAPLIFRKNFDAVYLKEMREIMDMIKRKMEGKGRERTQVKLGRGGIREIEFIIQFMELVHGGRLPEVRVKNSLDALKVLREKGILLQADSQFLAEAYRFLRNVEHRLQMVHGLQTHTLPKGTKDLARIAKAMGFTDTDNASAVRAFRERFDEVTHRVRELYEDVFKIKKRRDPSAQAAQAAMEGRTEDLEAALEDGIFTEARQAATNLKSLAGRLRRIAGARGDRLWMFLAPKLFRELALVPNPDRALNQFENFLHAASLPDVYVRYLLEKPLLFRLLLELFSNSLFLSEVLIRQPGNIDIVVRAASGKSDRSVQDILEGLEERVSGTPDWEARLDLLRDIRGSEILRVGLQDLLGRRELFESFAELSRLAISLSRSALGAATDKLELPKDGTRPSIPKGFCITAMGKLAGREMNYGSDLDVVFAYGDEEGKEIGLENYLLLAETFMRALDMPTTHGVAYKVDARLRPMGREAQMVHSVEAFRQYFKTHGQAAERLAYSRSVFMAGDRFTGYQLYGVIEDFVYGRGLTRKELESILDIRSQMEEKAKTMEGSEIKVSPGGIVDIEFFVQTLQVAYGKEKSLLRMPHLPTVMGYFKEAGIVPGGIWDELLEAYQLFRLVEARHRMVRETADDELPTDSKQLERLAWRAGFGKAAMDAEKMMERIDTTQRRVREIFNRLGEWVKFEE